MTTTDAGSRVRMNGDERRELIVRTARRLFAERGYHGTSTAEIARGASCSEAVLYRHFPSKQALLAAILKEASQTTRARWGAALEADDPFAAFVGNAQRLQTSEFTELVKLRSLAVTLVDEPEIRDALEHMADGWRTMLLQATSRSQERGHLRADVDAEDVALLFGALSFLAAFWHALGGDEALQRLVPVAHTLHRLTQPPQPEEAPQ